MEHSPNGASEGRRWLGTIGGGCLYSILGMVFGAPLGSWIGVSIFGREFPPVRQIGVAALGILLGGILGAIMGAGIASAPHGFAGRRTATRLTRRSGTTTSDSA
jgi:hypothetical protein